MRLHLLTLAFVASLFYVAGPGECYAQAPGTPTNINATNGGKVSGGNQNAATYKITVPATVPAQTAIFVAISVRNDATGDVASTATQQFFHMGGNVTYTLLTNGVVSPNGMSGQTATISITATSGSGGTSGTGTGTATFP